MKDSSHDYESKPYEYEPENKNLEAFNRIAKEFLGDGVVEHRDFVLIYDEELGNSAWEHKDIDLQVYINPFWEHPTSHYGNAECYFEGELDDIVDVDGSVDLEQPDHIIWAKYINRCKRFLNEWFYLEHEDHPTRAELEETGSKNCPSDGHWMIQNMV